MTANTTNPKSIGLHPGDKIDKYEVLEQIGAGGCSVVWKAYDRLLDKHVAVKQVTVDSTVDEETFRERFRAEAAIQKKAAQTHKHLVRIIDFIEEPRGYFILMEYVNGPSLEHLLAQNPGPVDVKTSLGIAAAAAVALGAIHDQKIVHRDLKPANILLPNEGGLKICDFGLASLMADQEMPAVGTVRYMAPEVLDGAKADARADIYSLGMMLYEMLIGRANFEDSFKTVLRDQRNVALRWMKWHTNLKVKATPIRQYVPAVPEAIAQLVERMMEKDANQRIASAAQLIDTMRRQLAAPATAAAASSPATFAATPTAGAVGDKTVKLKKKNKVILVAAVTILIWSILGIGYMIYTKSQSNAVERERQSLVHNDYRAATKLFTEEKWDEASLAFKQALETHVKYKGMPVPVAGNQRKPLEEAIDGHILFCEAKREFSMQNYDRTLELLNKATAVGAVDLKRIDDFHNDTLNLRDVGIKRKAILTMLDAGKYFAAQHEWDTFRRGGGYDLLSEEQKKIWDDLALVILSSKEDKQAQTVLAEAEAMDTAAAIGHLRDWIAKNPDNTNRKVRDRLATLEAGAEFENAVARGKSAEQGENFDLAIESYSRALQLNRKSAEEMGLPSKLNGIRGQVAFLAGKAAHDKNETDQAIEHLNNALAFVPNMPEAKKLLASIDSKGQRDALSRQAVAAFASKDYEKAISLWTRLRDEFNEDATTIGAEITKAEFQIAVRKMDEVWANGNDVDALKAIDEVMKLDPTYERGTTLKTLIETRRRILTLVSSADASRNKGEYGDGKRELRKGMDIAKTITDAAIREQLITVLNKHLNDLEFLDFYNKAKRDFELGKLDTARANILAALNTRTTENTEGAKALQSKIEVAIQKKATE